MLILLSLVAYLVLGLPFVAWLAHRLGQSSQHHTGEPRGDRPVAPEVVAG